MPKKKTPAKKATKQPTTPLEYKCTVFKQAGHEMVLFAAPAKELWTVVQINQREEEDDKGYQRGASPSRVRKIADFVDAGNVIPTCVLISFDDAELTGNGTIKIPRKKTAGWVIDGQHRLAGAYEAKKKSISLPCVAFIGLSLEEQIDCFITINQEQKGVPKSLYYDLLKKLPKEKSEAEQAKERAADLAASLRRDEKSAFFNRIVVTTSPTQGEQSLNNFVRKVAPFLNRKSGKLYYFGDEERQGILNNYYHGLKRAFPKEYKRSDSVFFKTVGFGALMNVLPNFLDLTLQHQHGFTVEDVEQVFRQVSHFDFGSWHEMGSGTAAENQAADDLRVELETAFSTSGFTGKLKL